MCANTSEQTAGFCFLLVATSSLWKVFSPQEAVDLVVEELWRQKRDYQQLQRQRGQLSKFNRGNIFQVRRKERSSRQSQGQTSCCNDFEGERAFGHGGCSCRASQCTGQKPGIFEPQAELTQEDEVTSQKARKYFCLQQAADLLERRFCEEWQLQREAEPLADLGLILLALEPSVEPSGADDTVDNSSLKG